MRTGPSRLPSGGRIDRDTKWRVSFNGAMLDAHPGDTLASALLANGVRLVGRSFKYHRPRGIFAAGVEEPNALVRLGRGDRAEPNTLATAREVHNGLEAFPQNCWPSLGLDLAALNSIASPLLPAGFYYKTFMGYGRGTFAWMFFERFIRRAAGMGVASKEADPDRYEKVNGFCDVLVVGGGPAGMSAALAAAATGAKVFLAEQDFEMGGSLLSEPPGAAAEPLLAELSRAVSTSPRITVLTRTTVFGAYDCGVFGLLERVSDHVPTATGACPRLRYWLMRTGGSVLASGALERPIVFQGNDLPGVMLSGAVRTYLNRFGVLAGRKALVFENNDSGCATALDLARAGASVVLVDMRDTLPDELMKRLRDAGIKILVGHGIVRASGRRHVKRAIVAPLDLASGERVGQARAFACDLVAVSGGWNPVVHLHAQTARPRYEAALRAHVVTDDPARGFFGAGACAGHVSFAEALSSGAAKGHQAAAAAGFSGPMPEIPTSPPASAEDWRRDYRGGWKSLDKSGGRGKLFIDVQNDVTLADVDLSHREGYVSVEHLKRYTTTGMGTDQGKTSSVNASLRVAELDRRDVAGLGTTGFRPPYTPVTFGALAATAQGPHFRPTRLSPIHQAHLSAGAVMVEAGEWLRPHFFPRAGESLGDASIREARHVRENVGITDVSTLGKIAVQGPDALAFLESAYANSLKTMKPGHLRYGVMLREDGFLLDDGTVARDTETEFLLTTTTGAASRVLSHLEFLSEAVWPHLRVEITSVTDQWGAIAISGRHSRQILQALVAAKDLSAAALPNMRFALCEIAGIPTRLHRMSYSGELAYEIFVPSGQATTLWSVLVEAGAAHAIVPYGTEAMSVLRIEKGHIAGGEIDGRTTLGDVGLTRLAASNKSYVGSVLKDREKLVDPSRPTLVGLVSDSGPMKSGSLLYSLGKQPSGNGEGHVSSVTYSPALDAFIALAFLERGARRHGEMVRCVNHTGSEDFLVRVVSPKFFDPQGQCQNG